MLSALAAAERDEPECHTHGVGLKESARSGLSNHPPRTRWLLLVVAIVVPVGIAAAHVRHVAPARHVAHARHVVVRYLSGGLLQKERDQLSPLVRQLALQAERSARIWIAPGRWSR